MSLPELRAIAQPPEYSPATTDRLYRLVSIYLSIPLARTGATPNAITLAWILIGLAGVGCVAGSGFPLAVTGALLLQLSYLLDFVDGEVARLTGRRSVTGGFLDLLGHALLKPSLLLATGAAAAAATGSWLFLLAGAVGAVSVGVGDNLRFYAACTLADLQSGDLGHAAPTRPAGRRRVTLARLAGALFEQTFETPGLYGLVLLAAVLERLDLAALYWAATGPLWLARRTVRYCRRMTEPESAGRRC